MASYSQFMGTDTYVTNEADTFPLPVVGSILSSPDYSSPAFYAYESPYPFPEFSFFDVLLPQLALYNQEYIQRINIIVFNENTNNVSSIRTYPATNDFSLNNLTQIQELYPTLA